MWTKFRILTKTRWQCKAELFCIRKLMCVCSWLNGFLSMLGIPPWVVFGQTWESLHLREPPSSMRTHQRGEITDWEYCNYCTFPHAWIAFDKTLKKLVLSNRAHHDATYLCAEWKYKWWVLQGNSIIMCLIIKNMLWGSGQNTHTQYFWSTQNIYCF